MMVMAYAPGCLRQQMRVRVGQCHKYKSWSAHATAMRFGWAGLNAHDMAALVCCRDQFGGCR